MPNGLMNDVDAAWNTGGLGPGWIGDCMPSVGCRPSVLMNEIGRAHVRTPVTEKSRMPSSA